MRLAVACILAVILSVPLALQQVANAQLTSGEVKLGVDAVFTDGTRRTIASEVVGFSSFTPLDILKLGKVVKQFEYRVILKLPQSTDFVKSVDSSTTSVRVQKPDGSWVNITPSKSNAIVKTSAGNWQIEAGTFTAAQVESIFGTLSGTTQIEIKNRGSITAQIGCCNARLGWTIIEVKFTADRLISGSKENTQPVVTDTGTQQPQIGVDVSLDKAAYTYGQAVRITVNTYDKITQTPLSGQVQIKVTDPTGLVQATIPAQSSGTFITEYRIPSTSPFPPFGIWKVTATATTGSGLTATGTATFEVISGTKFFTTCSDGTQVPVGSSCPQGTTKTTEPEPTPPPSPILVTGSVWSVICATFREDPTTKICNEEPSDQLPIQYHDIFGQPLRRDQATRLINAVFFGIKVSIDQAGYTIRSTDINYEVKIRTESGTFVPVKSSVSKSVLQFPLTQAYRIFEATITAQDLETAVLNVPSPTGLFALIQSASGRITLQSTSGEIVTADFPTKTREYDFNTVITQDGQTLPAPPDEAKKVDPVPDVGGSTGNVPEKTDDQPINGCPVGQFCPPPAPPSLIDPRILLAAGIGTGITAVGVYIARRRR